MFKALKNALYTPVRNFVVARYENYHAMVTTLSRKQIFARLLGAISIAYAGESLGRMFVPDLWNLVFDSSPDVVAWISGVVFAIAGGIVGYVGSLYALYGAEQIFDKIKSVFRDDTANAEGERQPLLGSGPEPVDIERPASGDQAPIASVSSTSHIMIATSTPRDPATKAQLDAIQSQIDRIYQIVAVRAKSEELANSRLERGRDVLPPPPSRSVAKGALPVASLQIQGSERSSELPTSTGPAP